MSKALMHRATLIMTELHGFVFSNKWTTVVCYFELSHWWGKLKVVHT